jgi:hypothetical protein
MKRRQTFRATKSWLAAAMMFGTAAYAIAEDLAVTSYYPSPRGMYNTVRTTGNTLLAQLGGRVGVGTAAPAVELEVNGTLRATRFIGPGMLPQGAIVMFQGGCPAGFALAGDTVGRVIYAGAYGAWGGGDTHFHTDPGHTHVMAPTPAVVTPDATHGTAHPGMDHGHVHQVFGSTNSPGGGWGLDCNNCNHSVNADWHWHNFNVGTGSVAWANPVLVPDDFVPHTHIMQTLGVATGVTSNGATTANDHWPPYVEVVFCEVT